MERLTDSLDRGWTPGPPIGRGTWGRSRLIRDDQGREAVLKEPLTDADFPADSPLPDDLVSACRKGATEVARLYQEARQPFLPRLEATIDLGGGRTGLVLPRYVTLHRRLESGLPLFEALKVVARVATQLADAGTVHGDLRPTNILFGERGEVFLGDPWTPALARHVVRLADHADCKDWLPPEARSAPATPLPGWDTWALCQVLHAAALLSSAGDGKSARIELARDGLDKVAVSALRDRAHARLATEGSNPRFRGRVAERLGALLARGLSRDPEPSPPFRFESVRELADRVNEVLALVRPKVLDVGRILLPGAAQDGVFQGEAEVAFSVTIGCTPGIAQAEDIVCGLQLVDLDAADGGRRPIEDASVDVGAHPSGRLRFSIGLGPIPPGRYRLRVAFAIKDSGDEPAVATGDFQVRPPPGYVPPPPELPSGGSAIPFPARAASDPARPGRPVPAPTDEPLTDPGADDEPGPPAPVAELAPFPRPVAPPEVDDEPPEADPASDPAHQPLVEVPPEPAVVPFPVRAPAPPPAAVAPVARVLPPAPALRALPERGPKPAEDDPLDTEELLADTDAIDKMLGPSAPPSTSQEGALPDLPAAAGDDLPGFDGKPRAGLPGPLASALELVRRDRTLSVGAAVAASLALVLVVSLLLKAC